MASIDPNMAGSGITFFIGQPGILLDGESSCDNLTLQITCTITDWHTSISFMLVVLLVYANTCIVCIVFVTWLVARPVIPLG